jgi:RecA-family ATPase
VVVDTLSQTYSGDENAANEMAAYLTELARRFRELWNCGVIVIHHSGHSQTERPRGSSAIRANTACLIGCFRDEKEMLATVACQHMKDGELFADATFALAAHEIGVDQDGDPVTSLVARHLSDPEDVGEAMQAEVKAGRGGKNQLLLSLLQNGQKESELRTEFYKQCDLDNTDAKRQAYHRCKAWALKAGFFEVSQGVVITLKA